MAASTPFSAKLLVGKCSHSRFVLSKMLTTPFPLGKTVLKKVETGKEMVTLHLLFSPCPSFWLCPLIGVGEREEEGGTLLQKKVLSQNSVSKTWNASKAGVLSYFVWPCWEPQVRWKQFPSQPVLCTWSEGVSGCPKLHWLPEVSPASSHTLWISISILRLE